MSLGHRLAGDSPVLDINSSDQGGIFLAGLIDTVIGQSFQVTIPRRLSTLPGLDAVEFLRRRDLLEWLIQPHGSKPGPAARHIAESVDRRFATKQQ